jgi:hypothetical protein
LTNLIESRISTGSQNSYQPLRPATTFRMVTVMKANFVLGIGSQRAGSTLLCRLLELHPEIRMNPLKELHYFDTMFQIRKQSALTDFSLRQLQREVKRLVTASEMELANKNWRWYVYTNFLLYTKSVDKISYWDLFPKEFADTAYCGESTPEYMLIDSIGLAEMRKTIGNAFVILSCRNPVERLISSFKLLVHYNQIKMDKGNLDKFFMELIAQNRPWFQHQLKYGDYLDAIDRYQQHFSEVCLIFYDDFFGNEGIILRQLSECLDLDFEQPQFRNFFKQRVNDLKIDYQPSKPVRNLLTEVLKPYTDALNEYAGRELLR